MNPPLLSIERLAVRYGAGAAAVTAVQEASLSLAQGTTHALVGESGSGKSTIARAILGLAPIVAGQVTLDGQSVDPASAAGAARMRRQVQMVFQNPYASLNPRASVGDAIGEALMLHRPEVADRAAETGALLNRVGLDPSAAGRFPHQFSGGQRQRIAIARALATGAPCLILDEVTSALDVSVQATILNLLRGLQRELGLSYLFISHDLAVVRYMSDAVSVLYLGRIVESGPREAIFAAPRHPYTQGLLAAVPSIRPGAATAAGHIRGEIGDPRNPPPGCRFHPRCPRAAAEASLMARCRTAVPAFTGTDRRVACHAEAEA